ncbi:hypothetical protein AAC387_Pa01g1551 [Persea americana]
MVGLIFPHLQYQQPDHIFSDHPINNITNTHNPHNNNTPALGAGVLSTANTVQESESRETHLWQSHPNFLKKPVSDVFNTSNPSSGIGQVTCKDCGNQAKKDCSHRRCRTCCRSHGFSCSTHVRSTWIPVARRRERQISGGGGGGLSVSTSTAKKARVIAFESNGMFSHISNSNTTPPRSSDTSSSQQDASFKESLPGHVQAPAVFKCVRVTAMDNGEDEYVYQAMVKIRGHVFRGVLYDQGIERRDGVSDISDLHLGGPGARNNGASSSPLLDHPDIYAVTGNGSVAAIAYGNTMS